jgi:transposase-like protein
MDREELKRLTKEEVGRRIREGVKAVIGQVLEEEMTVHLGAGYEGTQSRRGERNGHYTRDLIPLAGRIAQLRVPRDREGTFLTEVFARHKRMTGEVAVHLGLGPQGGRGWLGSSPARGAR